MSKPRNPIQMAVIGAAHGIRGELRVKPFTGDPMALGDYGPLFDADGNRYDLADIRPAKNVVVVRFKQVGDRNAAEALTGRALFVDRSMLPDELEQDEFYHADLVGLAATDTDGQPLGTVSGILDFGGGDIMEITLASGRTVLVPFTRAAVPTVDVAASRVTVDPVAAGMVDDGDEDDEEKPAGGGDYDPSRRPRGPRRAGGNR